MVYGQDVRRRKERERKQRNRRKRIKKERKKLYGTVQRERLEKDRMQ